MHYMAMVASEAEPERPYSTYSNSLCSSSPSSSAPSSSSSSSASSSSSSASAGSGQPEPSSRYVEVAAGPEAEEYETGTTPRILRIAIVTIGMAVSEEDSSLLEHLSVAVAVAIVAGNTAYPSLASSHHGDTRTALLVTIDAVVYKLSVARVLPKLDAVTRARTAASVTEYGVYPS